MYFIRFPVNSTNIFPIANSTAGGQLVTEYNLRSRESVGTDSAVQYMIGPSFVHSERDYKVTLQTDITGVPVSSSVLQIAPGRGVFNGHFVELLTPMTIDLNEANNQAYLNSLANSNQYSYLSARNGLCRKSSYAILMPSFNSVLAVQPNDLALLTSNSLRGVPFGRVVSHKI